MKKIDEIYNPDDYYHQKLKAILDSKDVGEQLAILIQIKYDGIMSTIETMMIATDKAYEELKGHLIGDKNGI